MNKNFIYVLVVIVAAGGAYLLMKSPEEKKAATEKPEGIMDNVSKPMDTPAENAIKEFTTTSSYDMKDGKPAPQFSLKEMTVKKGDRVRIKVTNIRGAHDFTINEYNISKETPLNEEVTVEFTADKAGEFVYYCSKMNHRELGQWGTLRVIE